MDDDFVSRRNQAGHKTILGSRSRHAAFQQTDAAHRVDIEA
jgi:hypothetical protein